MRSRQSYALNLASKFNASDKALEYIAACKEIHYYRGAFVLYDLITVWEKWDRRFKQNLKLKLFMMRVKTEEQVHKLLMQAIEEEKTVILTLQYIATKAEIDPACTEKKLFRPLSYNDSEESFNGELYTRMTTPDGKPGDLATKEDLPGYSIFDVEDLN